MSIFTHFPEDERRSNPRAALVRIEGRDAKGYGNQRRHDLRIGPQPAYVNEAPDQPNRILIDPMPTARLKKQAKQRRSQRATQRAMKSNAGIAVVGLIGFGIEAQSMFNALPPDKQDKALRAAAEKIATELNTTVSGLVLHLDETAPHAHVSFCGYDMDGKPISNAMKRQLFIDLQTALHEELLPYMPELERGRARKRRVSAGAKPHEVIHRSVAELHADLPGEIEGRRAYLETLKEKVRKNEDRAQKAREKAEADEDRAEKALKNAQIYERRAADAQAQIAELETVIEAELAKKADLEAARAKAVEERDQALEAAGKAEARAQEAEMRAADIDTKVADTAMLAAEAAAAVITGDLFQTDKGIWQINQGGPARDRLKQVWNHIKPAIERVAHWWDGVRARVDALPDPERDEFYSDVPPVDPDDPSEPGM
ncbi:plasmid recombination protein [Lentibacter sp. XHP0401]|uniref:plasmid recombination protein n=1 Tax=Lentibacter sp. XHP0401 TaxID=2984334 RepID=UPI0021E963E7|nr:plasmid recombination protein [Lentibacter sp. XHP0401]MCV2894619.1 plasmid recombination protein [Lentibacter sp. XHP0401]